MIKRICVGKSRLRSQEYSFQGCQTTFCQCHLVRTKFILATYLLIRYTTLAYNGWNQPHDMLWYNVYCWKKNKDIRELTADRYRLWEGQRSLRHVYASYSPHCSGLHHLLIDYRSLCCVAHLQCLRSESAWERRFPRVLSGYRVWNTQSWIPTNLRFSYAWKEQSRNTKGTTFWLNKRKELPLWHMIIKSATS